MNASTVTALVVSRVGQKSQQLIGEPATIDPDFIKIIVEEIIKEIQINGAVTFSNVSTVVSPAGNCTGILEGGRIS